MDIDNHDILADSEVRDVFNTLSQTASTLAKRDILSGNSDSDRFKAFINYLLNPFLITGISTKKITKITDKPPTMIFSSFLEMMDYILTNNTGSDEVIANINHFLSACDLDMRDFYTSIITKSARLGCDIKSVNKAFGFEFIPQWEVQQSYNIDKSPLKENEWFALTEKLNGVRGTYYEGKIISRQGKELIGLEHITDDIDQLFEKAENWVIDGELVRFNSDGLSDNENFRIGTGIISRDDANKSSIRFTIFDVLPKSEFIAGESELLYKDRLSVLNELRDKAIALSLSNISVVENLYAGTDTSKIDELLSVMVDEGREGLMLNRDSRYYRKRHNGILKVKRFYTIDLKVLEVEEGSGRLTGMLGAFVVDYKGNVVNVGSGMTDDQRVEFWQIRHSLPGRGIEVKYKEESSDKKTGLFSLQFPIFVSLREEGKEESYY